MECAEEGQEVVNPLLAVAQRYRSGESLEALLQPGAVENFGNIAFTL